MNNEYSFVRIALGTDQDDELLESAGESATRGRQDLGVDLANAITAVGVCRPLASLARAAELFGERERMKPDIDLAETAFVEAAGRLLKAWEKFDEEMEDTLCP